MNVFLEVEPELEFDQSSTRIVCTGNRKVSVGGSGLTEARAVYRCGSGISSRAQDVEVRSIERVEQLHPRLEVDSLGDSCPFHQIEIPPSGHRSVQENTVTEFTRLSLRPDVRRIRIHNGGVVLDLRLWRRRHLLRMFRSHGSLRTTPRTGHDGENDRSQMTGDKIRILPSRDSRAVLGYLSFVICYLSF